MIIFRIWIFQEIPIFDLMEFLYASLIQTISKMFMVPNVKWRVWGSIVFLRDIKSKVIYVHQQKFNIYMHDLALIKTPV